VWEITNSICRHFESFRIKKKRGGKNKKKKKQTPGKISPKTEHPPKKKTGI